MKTQTLLFTLFLAAALLSCTKPDNQDEARFNSLNADLQHYSYADYDDLMAFYYRLDSLCQSCSSNRLIYLKKTTEARLNFREADYQRSIQNLDEAMAALQKVPGADSLIAISLNIKGLNYMSLGVYDSAYQHFSRSAALLDSIHNEKLLHTVWSNMARLFYNKGDFDKAMEFIEKATANEGDIKVRLNALHLKANLYGTTGQIDSAMALDRYIIDRYDNPEYQFLISSFYNNLGRCYLEKGLVDSALLYCQKSYHIDSLNAIEANMASNLVVMGSINYEVGRKAEADSLFLKALKIYSDDKNADKRLLVFKVLAQYAERENDYQKLAVYRDSMLTIYGEVNSQTVNRTIERLNIEFESERKNHQLQAQQRQLVVQRVIVVLLAVVVLLILILFYANYLYRQKTARLKAAEQERKLLSLLVEAEQNERARIAADLHDSVTQKLAVTQMHLSMLDTVNPAKKELVNNLLNDTVADVRSIAHNLYPKDLDKGLIKALDTLCEQLNLNTKGLRFMLDADAALVLPENVEGLDLVLYRIAQELANNALKYSNAKQVVIRLTVNNQRVQMTVTDDGDGFDTTTIDKRKGLGLNTMKDRIRQINGNLDIKSQPGNGTSYTLDIPL
ncbi:MAG: tetratricopeptide repeat protein [Bacteroidales bacterium]|nr:tetratricopeptide repeat protein [Bacteroidales bacterium]